MIDMENPVPANSSPKARGDRLRYLRTRVLDYTIDEFANIVGKHEATIRQWQSGKLSGLSEKGAKQIASKLREAGLIEVNETWLLEGIGLRPEIPPISGETSEELPPLQKEINLFRLCHPNSTIMTISDYSLSPTLLPADKIGGIQVTPDYIKAHKGQIYIIKTSEGNYLAKKIESINDRNNTVVTSINVYGEYNPEESSALTTYEKLYRYCRLWRD